MIGQDLLHKNDAGSCREIRQPDQPPMPLLLEKDQAAEIFVHCDEDPLFGSRTPENFHIPGIVAPFARLDDFMPLGTQPVRESAPGATVNEESHSQETLTASSESCAMTASA